MKYVLFMYVDPEDKILEWYRTSIQTRNPEDSGFDLFNPDRFAPRPCSCFKIDYRVKCAMYELGDTPLEDALTQRETLRPQAFYLFPRSSIVKTNNRLSNSVGIIDNQYRGNIGAYFDVHILNRDTDIYLEPDMNGGYTCLPMKYIEEKDRLVQLCHPTLEPFHIVIVNSVEDLGSTRRGTGGFGSTGV